MFRLAPYRGRRLDRTLGSIFDWMTDVVPCEGESEPLALNVTEEKDQIVVETALPGVNEDDINISVQNNILTISAESKQQREDKDRGWFMREWRYGSFSRSIALPDEVNADKAEAELDKGILTIKLPRAKPSPIKKVAVKARKLLKGDK